MLFKSSHRQTLPLFAVIVLISLSGCGFQWRAAHTATTAFPSTLKNLQVVSTKPDHHFAKALAYRLQSAGVKPTKNGPLLRIISDKLSYTTQSLAYNVESRIYTFTYQVQFQLMPSTKSSAAIQTLSTQRRLVIRRNEALGSTDQVRLITEEMQDDLAQQLMHRLPYALREKPSQTYLK